MYSKATLYDDKPFHIRVPSRFAGKNTLYQEENMKSLSYLKNQKSLKVNSLIQESMIFVNFLS